MFFTYVLSALSVGIIVSIAFALGFHRRLHWSNARIFFIVAFLGAWAGGVWIPPFGPTILNVHWLPFLLAGIVMVLPLLAASFRTLSSRDHTKEKEVKFSGKKLSGLFIWTLVAILSIALIVAIVIGYIKFGYAIRFGIAKY